MDSDREHFAELNVKVKGTTQGDAERVLRIAAKLLRTVDGLEVSSVYIIRERHVPIDGD